MPTGLAGRVRRLGKHIGSQSNLFHSEHIDKKIFIFSVDNGQARCSHQTIKIRFDDKHLENINNYGKLNT